MPAVIQGQRVQQSVEQRVESIRTRVPQVVQEELSMGVQDLTSLVQEALPQASALRSEALPSVSLIVAGLFAPLQLQGLYASHAGRLGLCGALLGVDVIGLLVDGGKRCLTEDVFGPMNILHYWVAGDAALLAVTVATSLMAILRCNKTFAEMKVATDAPVNLPADPEAAFRVMMEGHLLNGARAMMEYDRLVQSVPFQMVYAVNVVDFFWQVAGWLLFFDTPGAECEAKFLLYWSRGRGMIFLIGFVPALVGLVMTLAKAATETRSFRAAVLQTAVDLDKQLFPSGPSVFTVLVRAFFLRDSSDMRRMELQLIQSEEGALAREVARIRAECARATAELEAAEAKHRGLAEQVEARTRDAQMDAREREFLEQYRQAVDVVLDAREAASAVAGIQQAAASGEALAAASAAAAALGGQEAFGAPAAGAAAAEAAAARGAAAEAAAAGARGEAQASDADVAEGTGGTGTVFLEQVVGAAQGAADIVLPPQPGAPAPPPEQPQPP